MMNNWRSKVILLVMILVSALSITIAVKASFLERSTYQRYVEVKQVLTEKSLRLKKETEASNAVISDLELRLRKTAKELDKINYDYYNISQKYISLVSKKDELNTELNSLTKEKMALEGKIRQMESNSFIGQALREKASLELEVNKLGRKISQQEREARQLVLEKADLKTELSILAAEKEQTKEIADEALQVSDVLSQDLAREKKDRIRFAEGLDKKKTEGKYLKEQINSLNREKAALENRLTRVDDKLKRSEVRQRELMDKMADLNSSLKEKSGEVEELKMVLVSLRDRLAAADSNLERSGIAAQKNNRLVTERSRRQDARDAVELSPIVVKSSYLKDARSRYKPVVEAVETEDVPEGRVLTVNKEYEFVVINLGQRDGIKTGMPFTVYRGGEAVAKLEVLEAHPKISAADIKSINGKKKDIEINDIVVLSEELY
ncbi:MAG: hypothetical protein U9R31_01110 [Candidatus Omnitrophota bacterium]|nr:hypothetical protein [Candidatus Omnitrophota bacterium]